LVLSLQRLRIPGRLIENERPVGELAESLGLRDSTVSRRLSLLRSGGWVRAPGRADHLGFDCQSASTARSRNPVRDLLQARLHVRAVRAAAQVTMIVNAARMETH
jgi:DNA-binding IclR family transcriptional regulator